MIDSLVNARIKNYRDFTILKKDGICEFCEKTILSQKLHVHHINGNKKDNRICNLILCCCLCHTYIHHGTKRSHLKIRNFRGKASILSRNKEKIEFFRRKLLSEKKMEVRE